MDAAGEQQVELALAAGPSLRQQHFDHLFPQRETGDRPDVAAAFAALEHEAACALFDIHLQQRRGRGMDIGGNAATLELRGLVGTAAGDQRIAGLARPDRFALLVAQGLRHEAEHAHTPGHIADLAACGLQHLAHLRPAHQRQRQERQGAAASHIDREFGAVRDACHRTLCDRETRAVRFGQRRAGRQVLESVGGFDELLAGGAHRLHQFADAFVALAIDRRHADALAQRQQLIGGPAQTGPDFAVPDLDRQLATFGVARMGFDRLQRFAAGPRIDPARRIRQFSEQPRLGTVEACQLQLDAIRQRGFVEQQQLVVEHHAGGAGDAQTGCGMQADSATHMNRLGHFAEQLLGEDIGGVVSDPATGLVALGDVGIGLEAQRRDVVRRTDFGEQRMRSGRQRFEAIAVRVHEHHYQLAFAGSLDQAPARAE